MSRSYERHRKLEQAALDADALSSERWALTEVLERMQVDARAYETRAVSAERASSMLESKLDKELQRRAEVAKEMSELARQLEIARRQIAAGARRLAALEHEKATLDEELCDERRQISTAETDLGGAVERMTRLDYKLRFSESSTSLRRR